MRVDLAQTIPEDLGRVHFIGIGGSGMHGIAEMMKEAGVPVSGSDRTDSPIVAGLRSRGIPVAIGQSAANVEQADTVVATSAIFDSNPELAAARQAGITVLHRSQALKWLTRGKRVIAVAGAHGKTTSTGMIVTALRALGEDPSFVDGGVIAELGVSSAWGKGDLFILEADESDGSFQLYDTVGVLITNIDTDHLDFYGGAAGIEDAFVRFANHATDFVVTNGGDRLVSTVLDRFPAHRTTTFGVGGDVDVHIDAIDTSEGPARVIVTDEDGTESEARLVLPGVHNAVNAVGAATVLERLGFPFSASLSAAAAYRGTGRRFELRGVVRGVSVYDDYAHHPTEVASVLDAARTVNRKGRVIAVHQPHLYTRTRDHVDEFAEVLGGKADYTVVLDVCAARELPIEGINGAWVADHFVDQSRVFYEHEWSDAAEKVADIARPGDTVITLGCGDVNLIVPQLLEALGQRA